MVLKTEANEFAEKMNMKDFHASGGWLDRLKKSHNISLKAVSGEGNTCTSEMTALWEEKTLEPIFLPPSTPYEPRSNLVILDPRALFPVRV